MADLRPSHDPAPEPGPPDEESRVAMALLGLADVRVELLAAQRSLSESVARLSEVADGPLVPPDPA